MLFRSPPPDRDTLPAKLINDELYDMFEPPALNLDVEPYEKVPVGQLKDELWKLIDELPMEE